MLDTDSIRRRYSEALGGSRLKLAIVRWGYRQAARDYPFEPVWNRRFFRSASEVVGIPVFAVGGIRTRGECDDILESGEADMVGIGRPFYAEPQLPAKILSDPEPLWCENSNRCVPAQMLGLPARCYNPSVSRKRAAARRARTA
jgi:2,4-dienoyl-CoA reductase-like NADH-dependent reductase (Old Yellow Enzyme family)